MFKPTQFFSEVLAQLGGLGFALLMLLCVHDAGAQQLVFPGPPAGIRTTEIVNIKVFGALCNSNGTAGNGNDDTVAIQNAINNAQSQGGTGFGSFSIGRGATVFFPPGIC